MESTGTMKHRYFRLITRNDFDGLVCAVLLKHLKLISDIKFVHPKDMQDGKITVTDADISTNLPYIPGVHVAFDHHLSETMRIKGSRSNHIIDPKAPSTARVVWQHYGGHDAFPHHWDDMMLAVDKADTAQLSQTDVLYPAKWQLLNFMLDARTGLERFSECRLSHDQVMMHLIEYSKDHNIDEILNLPDIKARADFYFKHEQKFQQQIQCCTTVHKNLVVLDLRDEDIIWPGNRFIIYTLFPQCNISIYVLRGLEKQNTVFAAGKSIFNRTAKINVGGLMLNYTGGGHEATGTCQVDNDEAESVLQELIAQITAEV